MEPDLLLLRSLTSVVGYGAAACCQGHIGAGRTVLATADLTRGIVAVQWASSPAPHCDAGCCGITHTQLKAIHTAFHSRDTTSSPAATTACPETRARTLGHSLASISDHAEVCTPLHRVVLHRDEGLPQPASGEPPLYEAATATAGGPEGSGLPRTIITATVRDGLRGGKGGLGWSVMRKVGEACRGLASAPAVRRCGAPPGGGGAAADRGRAVVPPPDLGDAPPPGSPVSHPVRVIVEVTGTPAPATAAPPRPLTPALVEALPPPHAHLASPQSPGPELVSLLSQVKSPLSLNPGPATTAGPPVQHPGGTPPVSVEVAQAGAEQVGGGEGGDSPPVKASRNVVRHRIVSGISYAEGLRKQIGCDESPQPPPLPPPPAQDSSAASSSCAHTDEATEGSDLQNHTPLGAVTPLRCGAGCGDPLCTEDVHASATPCGLNDSLLVMATPGGLCPDASGLLSPMAATPTSVVTTTSSLRATLSGDPRCGLCNVDIPFDGSMLNVSCCEGCLKYSCEPCLKEYVEAATRKRMLGAGGRTSSSVSSCSAPLLQSPPLLRQRGSEQLRIEAAVPQRRSFLDPGLEVPSGGGSGVQGSLVSLISPKFLRENCLACPHPCCSEILPVSVVQAVIASTDCVFCRMCRQRIPFDGTVDTIPFCEGCARYTCEKCFASSLSQQILKEYDTPRTPHITCSLLGCSHHVSQADLRKYLPKSLFDALEKKVDCLINSRFPEGSSGKRFKCPSCGINIEKDTSAVGVEVAKVSSQFKKRGKSFKMKLDFAEVGLGAALHFTEHRFRCTNCSTTFCDSCFLIPYHIGKSCSEAANPCKSCRYCETQLTASNINPMWQGSSLPPRPPVTASASSSSSGGGSWWRRKFFSGNNAPAGNDKSAASGTDGASAKASSGGASGASVSDAAEAEAAAAEICSAAECVEKFSTACKKRLPCGHFCLGAGCDEKVECIPCLHSDCPAYALRMEQHAVRLEQLQAKGGEVSSAAAQPLADPKEKGKRVVEKHITTQTADEFCTICWSESLMAAPCVQLACGHVVHLHCVVEKLERRWPTPRIAFSFMGCTLCSAEMDHAHPSIQALLTPLRRLRKDLSRKWMDRLKIEGLANAAPLAEEGNQFHKAPMRYAEHILNYYMCFKCEKPYYGGVKRCDVLQDNGGGEVREVKRNELVCGACVDKTSCPKHGTEYIQFKCRYCCAPAVWFCWGTTHFCDRCHRSLPNPIQRCAGPATCPLKVDHPPNGQEFVIGCVACVIGLPTQSDGKKEK